MAVRPAEPGLDGNVNEIMLRAFRILNDGSVVLALANPDGSFISAVSPVITSASANAFTVGPNGTTNPTFNIDTSTASAVTGINIKSNVSGSGVALSVLSSGTNDNISINAKGNGTVQIQNITGSIVALGGPTSVTSTSVNSFSVGPTGFTNPIFNVDSSEANAATGVQIEGFAAGSGVNIETMSTGTNENLNILTKGTGTLVLNSGGNFSVFGGNVGVDSTSMNALAVGPTDVTNPVFRVDASTASVATGITIKGAAAGAGVAITVISTGTNEGITFNAKGSGTIVIGGTSTGQVSIGRGFVGTVIFSSTTASLGTVQNSTPTAAQLLGGVVTQTSATGAGTVTLPTGTQLSTAVTGVAVGDIFQTVFANLGGGFNLTITGATGSTVIGNAVVPSGKNAEISFVNTGANTWNVYVAVSA